ncbi:MAG: hypothetical protein ACREJO_17385 [Phycisphaerales bacterium]
MHTHHNPGRTGITSLLPVALAAVVAAAATGTMGSTDPHANFAY